MATKTDTSDVAKFTTNDLDDFTAWLYGEAGVDKPQQGAWWNHIPDGFDEETLREVDAEDGLSREWDDEDLSALREAKYAAYDADDYADDEDRAKSVAERIFRRLRRRSHRDTVALFFSNAWWANEKLGEWDTVWSADLEAETEKAFCVTNAIPKDDWGEDSYFQHKVTEDVWLPKSAVRVVKVEEPEGEDTLILDAGNDRRGKASEADVKLYNVHEAYGTYKVYASTPAPWGETEEEGTAAKEAIKGMDWDATHRTFSKEEKAWEFDVSAVETAVDRLNDAGLSVAVDGAVERFLFDVEDSVASGLEDRRVE